MSTPTINDVSVAIQTPEVRELVSAYLIALAAAEVIRKHVDKI